MRQKEGQGHGPYLDYDRQCVVLQYVGQGQRAFTPHEGGLSGGRKWRPVRVHVRTAGAAPSPSGHQVVLGAGHLHVQTGKHNNRTKSRYSISGRVGMWCSRWNPIAVGDRTARCLTSIVCGVFFCRYSPK